MGGQSGRRPCPRAELGSDQTLLTEESDLCGVGQPAAIAPLSENMPFTGFKVPDHEVGGWYCASDLAGLRQCYGSGD